MSDSLFREEEYQLIKLDIFAEKIVISSSESFRYEFVPAPRNREGLVFEVRSGGGVHIALSDHQMTTPLAYQLILGALDNTVSYIARGKHGQFIINAL